MWLIWTLAGAYNCSVQLLCCTQLCDRLSWTVTSVCVWSLFIHWPCFSLNLCDFTVHVWTRNSMGLYFIVSNTISKSNLQNNIYANKCSCYLNRCYTSSIVPLRLAIEKERERVRKRVYATCAAAASCIAHMSPEQRVWSYRCEHSSAAYLHIYIYISVSE